MPSELESTLYRIETEGNISCVSLKGLQLEEDTVEEQPVHFIVLLDQSGSMASHNRLKNAV